MSAAVVCFGEALIDFLAAPELPGAPHAFLRNAGGAPANVAVATARLGGTARFVGMLGQDLFGDFLHDELRAAGVDTAGVHRTGAANTALAFVKLDPGGERSFSFYRSPSADLLFTPAHFSEADFTGCAAFHVCSNSLTGEPSASATLAGMRLARTHGALVSMDLNLRPALWDAGADIAARVWPALCEADLVKLSRPELDWLAAGSGGEAAVLARLFAAHARLVVVTDGPAPLHWHAPGMHGEHPVHAVTARDTTGAGDAFVAGLLHGLVERGIGAAALDALVHDPDTLAATLSFAAGCGALATQRHGAFAAMPTRADIDAHLECRA
ncbi:carbohydrate kinase [Luteimonas sp. BDR2-5]|uniref:carbohydrate kinase family protein n=1 Tax=Proluteimonas luteida TaxID=2878685 RepID=UPI001E45E7DA|nr:carbohydrate kinase [Luteimonas sp. BDR2-5]MCD9026961.1 carbohydrate kinase [Luteimonas sp. BDR2-5]